MRVGIGLDAGEAVPVEDGYRGAALNLAARLCAAAGPGEILVSEGVVHLAGAMSDLPMRARDGLSLKGVGDSVRAFEVTIPRAPAPIDIAGATDAPAELDRVGPLVGRDREAGGSLGVADVPPRAGLASARDRCERQRQDTHGRGSRRPRHPRWWSGHLRVGAGRPDSRLRRDGRGRGGLLAEFCSCSMTLARGPPRSVRCSSASGAGSPGGSG